MGSVANKYRVHEVAKDFGIATKDVTEILTKYAETPKNHMQVLEDRELSLIFEYLTQHNQIASIATIFAEGAKVEEKKPEPKKQQPQQGGQQGQNRQQPQQQAKPQGDKQGVQQPQKPMSRVPQKQVVDTRKATNVNLDKYDEKLQDMADRSSSRGGRRDKDQLQGKEKFRNSKQRQNGPMTNKRKQEEADRMRRLRLEVIKNTPVTVQIPDEISVGELASRMKKTGAEVVKCLMKNGVMASLSQMIDFDTAAIIAEEMGCKVEKEVVVTIEEKLTTIRTRKRIWCPAHPWWWSWAMWTTARPACWTISAMPMWPPARPAASPSTSAPIRWRSTASPSPSWIPRVTRRLPPCAPAAPW